MSGTAPGGVWSDGDRRFEAARLESFAADLFTGAGCERADAERIAAMAVATDVRGTYSHGCARIPTYVEWMLEGRVDPRGRPSVRRDSGSVLVVDGGNSLGHVGLGFATDLVIERAGSTGFAVASVGHSNHCGAMASYALRAVGRDRIVLATTNALPTMAWPGGRDRILGINPVGVLIPAGSERPILIDTSFGVTALGRIAIHAQQGLPLPDGWATDREGRPTNDADAALDGLIRPAGGYKGASMALLMGILSTLLSGAAYGTELGGLESGPRSGQDGQFVLAIDIGAFEDATTFKGRVDAIIGEIHASRPAPGHDRVLVPGDLEAEAEERHGREGVPLTEMTRAHLGEVAERVGVDAGFLA